MAGLCVALSTKDGEAAGAWPTDSEIRIMDVLDLTFIPEARKKPIIDALLHSVKWRDIKHVFHRKRIPGTTVYLLKFLGAVCQPALARIMGT
jgi:hypothetical protein